LTTVRGDRHIGPPKTGKSRRRVSIDAVTLDALKAHRKRQRVERIAGTFGRTKAIWSSPTSSVSRFTRIDCLSPSTEL
jgi:hypothetical protein